MLTTATVQAPTVHAITQLWESACGAKARWPGSVIVRSGARPFATYYVVNRAYWDLWYEDRVALPNERKT